MIKNGSINLLRDLMKDSPPLERSGTSDSDVCAEAE